MLNEVFNEDCLEGMKRIPSRSIDMILCDLPYGTTQNKWDTVIPFAPLWEQYWRIVKPNAAIVLTAQDKFTCNLILSEVKNHRYNLVWLKSRPTGFLNANKMPLRCHEDICVFYKNLPVYNPQFTEGRPNNIKDGSLSGINKNNNYGGFGQVVQEKTTKKHPKSFLDFKNMDPSALLHPTQKPVALFEYLIKTYTNEGNVVLDNCMGSGTTAIACLNTGRNFIGFEKDPKYFDILQGRILKHTDPVTYAMLY